MGTTARSVFAEASAGVLLPFRGVVLLVSTPRLALLAAIPVAVTILVTAGVGFGLWGRTASLLSLLWPEPAACDGCSWLATGAAQVGAMIWALASGAVWLFLTASAALVVSRVASAPVMDLLAREALKGLGVRAPDGVRVFGVEGSIFASIIRAAGRTTLLVAGYAALFAVSLLPGAAIVTTPASFAWTAAWLFVDTSLYALQWTGEARLVDVRSLFQDRRARSAAFSATSAVLMLVPFAGLFVTPATVAGACLLVRDRAAGG